MDTSSAPPNSRRSFRKSLGLGLREKLKKLASSSFRSAGPTNDFIHLPAAPQDHLPCPIGAERLASTHRLPANPRAVSEEPSNFDDSKLHTATCTESDTVIPTTSRAWDLLHITLGALHKTTNCFPPLQSAISALIPCIDILHEVVGANRKYDYFVSELTLLSDSLVKRMEQSNSMWMSDAVASISLAIQQQALLIERDHNTFRRLLQPTLYATEFDEHYRRIGLLFQQLSIDINMSAWCTANEHLANTLLEGLAPVKLAAYDSNLSTELNRRACTAGTRTEILSDLDTWSISSSSSSANLYWMNGMAGTGKTTIAYTFSELLDQRKQLAASFFCARNSRDCRAVNRIIPTIAYQLARYSMPFQSALCEVLNSDPDMSTKKISKQFERLLKEPFDLIRSRGTTLGSLVVVIDALDECDSNDGVDLLLRTLFEQATNLPLKFFVTSRPEPEVYSRMVMNEQNLGAVLHLHEIEKSVVQEDIQLYLKEELQFVLPTPAQLDQLAARSGNLFIYAATLVRYIRSSRRGHSAASQNRLLLALAMTSQSTGTTMYAAIDALYATILETALAEEDMDESEMADVHLVLWTAICVQEPVDIGTITALGGLDGVQRALASLEMLRSVIRFSETSGLVSVLHASFTDFVCNQERAGRFFCDEAKYNQQLAQNCFSIMKMQLQFNICELESSFLADAGLRDLESRIEAAISPSLSYACRRWGNHLKICTPSDTLDHMLEEHVSNLLLFWMEVLNLKREIGGGQRALWDAEQWLKLSKGDSHLLSLLKDAREFLANFAASPASISTPHIYISALPFCPKLSSVYKNYWSRTRGLVNATGTAVQRRGTYWETEQAVLAAAYSPIGECIALGYRDGTVSVLSPESGLLIAGPLILDGLPNSISSIVFSPDGLHVAFGSYDCTIRIWAVHHNSSLASDPFREHRGTINCLAYSPDGSRIAAGSFDHTITIWDVRQGKMVIRPLHGHTGSVESVAYSPDGTRIVSGSWDCTVRIWNTSDGTLSMGPLRAHSDWVQSVAYSPDGVHIASGSRDQTIRIWRVADGAHVAGPFQGHRDSVNSVAYSPSGAYILSGSSDHTMRVWRVSDGAQAIKPLQAPDGPIEWVGYSPGAEQIASRGNGTLRTWSIAHEESLEDRIEVVYQEMLSREGKARPVYARVIAEVSEL